MDFSALAHRAAKFASDNSPAILTAIGVTGTLMTALFAGKASFRASEMLWIEREEARRSTGDPLYEMSGKRKFQVVWKQYIPAAGMACTTVACIVMANRIGTRRAAALAAAYSLSEKAFEEYKEKVVEKLGARKEQAVRDEVAQDRVTQNVGAREVLIIGTGDVLFLDTLSGRYFKSDMESVRRAVNEVNSHINNYYFASVSDFYDEVGLSRTAMSEELGWNADKMMSIDYTTALTEDNRPCIVLNYKVSPIREYNRLS